MPLRERRREDPKPHFLPSQLLMIEKGWRGIIGTKVRRVQRNQTVLSINSSVRISISKHTFTRQPPLPPLLPLLPSEKIGLVSIAFPPPKSKDSLRPPVTRVSIRSTHELKRRSGFSSLFSVQGTRSEDHRPPPTDYSSDQNGGGRWRRTRATEDACKFQWMFEGEEGNEKTDPLLAPPFLLRPLSPHARGETAAKSLVDFPPPPSLPTYGGRIEGEIHVCPATTASEGGGGELCQQVAEVEHTYRRVPALFAGPPIGVLSYTCRKRERREGTTLLRFYAAAT